MVAALFDLRSALRYLRRRPAFSLGAAATLAFGIALNALLFTLADRLVWRSLPGVVTPARLASATSGVISYPLYRDFDDHAAVRSAFTGLAAW